MPCYFAVFTSGVYYNKVAGKGITKLIKLQTNFNLRGVSSYKAASGSRLAKNDFYLWYKDFFK